MTSSAIAASVGIEWIVDATGCSPELLGDVETIRRICERIIHDLDLRVVGEGMWRKFPRPGGVTGLFLLTESHLACHTYPELGVATFNLYCCKHRPDWPWETQLTDALHASAVTLRVAIRGENATRSNDENQADSKERAISAKEVLKH
jgi:S-adenosylmethionine decarboxylase